LIDVLLKKTFLYFLMRLFFIVSNKKSMVFFLLFYFIFLSGRYLDILFESSDILMTLEFANKSDEME